MAKFKRKNYGGERPVYTDTPVMVLGGFNLDPSISIAEGETIPIGVLAEINEMTRLIKIQKTARVVSINATDSKKVSLECNTFLNPLFVVGEKVLKTISGTYAAAPSISKVDYVVGQRFEVTLSAAITGLAVGDILMAVIADDEDNAAMVVPEPYALTIEESEEADTAPDNELGVDVTINSGRGSFYLRRIHPIPASLLGTGGVYLKSNPNITFTNSK